MKNTQRVISFELFATNFLATCPEGRFVLSRIFCMRCDQFLFLIYDDRHCFSPSAPNLFPVKYLCLVRS